MNRKILACLLCLFIPSNFYGSVDFDGTNDYLNCGSYASTVSDATLAAWIKIDPAATVQLMYVISLGVADSIALQLGVTQAASDPAKFATYCNSYLPESGGTKDVTADCASAQCIAVNEWYHIACVDDSNTGTLTPYINGVKYTAATGEGIELASHDLLFAADTGFSVFYKGEIADGIYIASSPPLADIETMAFSRTRNYVYPTDSASRKQFYFPLDDFPDGVSVSGKTFVDRTGIGNSCTGTDGGTARADILRYP